MKLTVACVLVRGHVEYVPEYVVRLRSMCQRSLPDHDFVCLTDQGAYLPGIDTIPVKKLPGFAWWTKIELFNKKHEQLQSGKILYLDLDTLIVGDLYPIVTNDANFQIVPTAGNFQGKGAKKVVKRYNSSAMCWNGGEFNMLFDDWSPAVTERLWGDQDWIGERLPDLSMMPLHWFPRLSDINDRNVEKVVGDAKVLLCKKPKNMEAAKLWEWFDKAWR